MADTIITPSTLALNYYMQPTTVSPYALFSPTTTVTYGIKLPEEGKVGLFAMYLAASSAGSVRLKITPPSSTDGAFGYGVGNALAAPGTNSTYATFFMGPDAIAASSYSFMFWGPFESARYGSLSTAGTGRLLRCVFDASTAASGAAGILSSNSTTLATVATTIKVFAFQMP